LFDLLNQLYQHENITTAGYPYGYMLRELTLPTINLIIRDLWVSK